MSWKNRFYNRIMKCATVGCETPVPPQSGNGRPKRYCSGRCRDNRQQRQYKGLREFSDIPKPPKEYSGPHLGDVTQEILDSLGVDEPPNKDGKFRSTELQVFYGGSDSWSDHLSYIDEVPILKGER